MLTFNTLLRASNIDPANVRLARNHDTSGNWERTCHDLWLAGGTEFEFYLSLQGKEVFDVGDNLAAFVVTPQNDTLFVGMYAVNGLGKAPCGTKCPIRGKLEQKEALNLYKLVKLDQLGEYEGLLVIEWGKGYLAWVQKAAHQDKRVLELRRSIEEPKFPGFTELCVDIGNLGSIPQGWKSILKAVGGIYLLVCKKTGGRYVGSAYGEEGFWGRWTDYAQNGHGGNVELKKLNSTDWQATVLEVVNPTASQEDVVAIENSWKEKLKTREFGLNEN